ncbi:PHP domain-containing protein [Nocardioides sp. WL0053]|uniref:PHP domain-containing protein n=1 Tax=Nocardioides jiangsuensis TaxID=2866161 RepID=A0ABS7RK55_9ACTN|nr:PHP domain-containing protein [Nocardioides jiangsuensis]MBY9075434.1 PHP domain-containing protein [Nocardioides jiangsuensis]
MRIDLHTHSDRSDGTMTPADLVRHAREEGIDVLGLTDHDTTEGWAEAAEAAEEAGLTLVRGIELSCVLQGSGVHLLAYLPDPEHRRLGDELVRILEGRNARLPATLERLRRIGIDIEADDVRRLAGDAAAMGRPHVADALVAKGVVRDRGEAFDRYLGPQGPAYVHRYAADLVTMIDTVADAGGVSVIAHPWAKRHNHQALDEAGLAALKEAGLAGVEVDHQDHDTATRDRLRSVARNLDLLVTGSSDFHGEGKVDHDLGCNTTDPDEYARLLDLARAAERASGRRTPEVVGR